MARSQEGLRLLSLDGGGICGLSLLITLRHIMYRIQQEYNLPTMPLPCDYFSLMGGTSTGGIIALMLGPLRMSIDDAIEAYRRLSKMVFTRPKSTNGQFSAKRLEEAVKYLIEWKLGNKEAKLLDENTCKTFVCARNSRNMNAGIPILFRSYHSPDEPGVDCKIWEAARATSAAPTFFKPMQIGTQAYVDGGMGHNNPTPLVLQEARRIFPNQPLSLVLSIGTGKNAMVSIQKPLFFRRKVVSTDAIRAIEQIATDCEKIHQDVLRRFQDYPADVYFRFNVEQGMRVLLSYWSQLLDSEAHAESFLRHEEVKRELTRVVGVFREIIEQRELSVL